MWKLRCLIYYLGLLFVPGVYSWRWNSLIYRTCVVIFEWVFQITMIHYVNFVTDTWPLMWNCSPPKGDHRGNATMPGMSQASSSNFSRIIPVWNSDLHGQCPLSLMFFWIFLGSLPTGVYEMMCGFSKLSSQNFLKFCGSLTSAPWVSLTSAPWVLFCEVEGLETSAHHRGEHAGWVAMVKSGRCWCNTIWEPKRLMEPDMSWILFLH